MSMQELFAEAVERLAAGEPVASIVASYPADVRDELSGLLEVVEFSGQLVAQPLPAPAPERRSHARATFLQQANALRADLEETLGQAVVPPLGTHARPPAPQPSWWAQLRSGWRSLLDAPVLRLAPLAAVILAVYLATFWTVKSAEAALPGDAVYPLKQWMREQRVNLAPPAGRIAAIQAAQEELAAEAKSLVTQPRARSPLAQEFSESMVYYGRQGDLLLIGPFLVAPNFQPDANVEAFAPMTIEGSLQPGATVELTYRMLPGNPSVVQGVRAVVVDSPKPAPQPTATPTRQPAGDAGCRPNLPEGWIPYAVAGGDSLARLAERSGASVATIQRVNCLAQGSLAGVSTLYLPDRIYVRVTPPAMPTETPAPLPTRTPIPSETPTPLDTPSPQPPTTVATLEPGDETAEPTAEATTEATAQPTAQATTEPTTEPTAGATAEVTAEATARPTTDATSQPTVQPGAEATDEPTSQPGVTATATATSQPAGTATPQPSSEATAQPTTAGTLAPTVDATAQPAGTATAAPGVTVLPSATVATDAGATLQPTIQPTLQPTVQPTAGVTATPGVTVQAAATSQPTIRPTTPPTAPPATAAPPPPAPTQPPPTTLPTTLPPTQPPPTAVPPIQPPTESPTLEAAEG